VRFEIYKDKQGDYRWRLVAANGRITAESGEGYSGLSHVNRAVKRLQRLGGGLYAWPIVVVQE